MILLAVLAFAAAILCARLPAAHGATVAERLDSIERLLRRFGPSAVAIGSVVAVWYVWGALRPVPTVQDEASYLLQADIFAHGHWTAPSPPIPEFFEQPHVLVVPAVASKYPPGHALLLSVGALVHFAPLVPLLLTAVTAALLFTLMARTWNVWIALVASLVWISAPIVLRFNASYLSEVTTATLVLVNWWLLLAWRETRRMRWLVLLGLAVGWGGITRPLTMLAFAIPIAALVVRDALRGGVRAWRPVVASLLVALATTSILLLWSARTTGDWRLTPLELYRRDYLPFDKYGFTPDTSPPLREPPPALRSAYDYYRHLHVEQRARALPRIAGDRALNVLIAFFQGTRVPLLVFAIVGLFALRRRERGERSLAFAAMSALLLFVAHLPYAHWAEWTVYYLEAAPVLAAITAVGLWRVLLWSTHDEQRARVGALATAMVLLVLSVPIAARWRRDHATRSRLDRSFAAAVARLPPHTIVFVHYSPRTVEHVTAVSNHANLAAAPVWVVHDLGARDAELRRLAPDRASLDFDEDQLVHRQ